MYTEYTTKNLNEYRKINAVIDSTKNPEQFEVVKNMVDQFGRNCDFRLAQLKHRANIDFLNRKCWKEYFSYKTTATIQVEHVIEICNIWVSRYNEWLAQQKQIEEEIELDKKKRINISGFSTLFQKKKRKKKGNQ